MPYSECVHLFILSSLSLQTKTILHFLELLFEIFYINNVPHCYIPLTLAVQLMSHPLTCRYTWSECVCPWAWERVRRLDIHISLFSNVVALPLLHSETNNQVSLACFWYMHTFFSSAILRTVSAKSKANKFFFCCILNEKKYNRIASC